MTSKPLNDKLPQFKNHGGCFKDSSKEYADKLWDRYVGELKGREAVITLGQFREIIEEAVGHGEQHIMDEYRHNQIELLRNVPLGNIGQLFERKQ